MVRHSTLIRSWRIEMILLPGWEWKAIISQAMAAVMKSSVEESYHEINKLHRILGDCNESNWDWGQESTVWMFMVSWKYVMHFQLGLTPDKFLGKTCISTLTCSGWEF